MVFQQAADQLFCRTVYDEIAFEPLNFGYSRTEANERVNEAIEAVSLDPKMLLLSPFSLSGGEMKMVALQAPLLLDRTTSYWMNPSQGLTRIGKKKLSTLSKKHGTEELQL